MKTKSPTLYSAEEAAARLGNRGDKAVRNLAAKYSIGTQVAGVWVFTDADLARFREIPTTGGRPRTEGRIVRHRWGPDIEGMRTCKNCGAVSAWDGEHWSTAEPCK